MIEYDFKKQPNRLHESSVKWRESENNPNLLQLWVADMDFQVMPEIREALITHVSQDILGYTYPRQDLYQAIINWEMTEHGYGISKDCLLFIDGVVPALSIALQSYTQEGDAVLINSPVYPPFARTIQANNRKVVRNELVISEGRYTIDFEQLEKQISEEQVKLYFLCNPHNPGGRVWSQEELFKIGTLCQKYQVLLVSDEIHQDLALFGNKHHSFNTIRSDFNDFSIILSSATKTFNIAGIKNSFAMIENPILRRLFKKTQIKNNQLEIPTVGLVATEAAYTYGRDWLNQLKKTLEENITFVTDFLGEYTKIRVMKPEGTYLIWLDFTAYGLEQKDLMTKLKEEAHLVLNDGETFGKSGKGYARFNAATPMSVIVKACQRLARVFPK